MAYYRPRTAILMPVPGSWRRHRATSTAPAFPAPNCTHDLASLTETVGQHPQVNPSTAGLQQCPDPQGKRGHGHELATDVATAMPWPSTFHLRSHTFSRLSLHEGRCFHCLMHALHSPVKPCNIQPHSQLAATIDDPQTTMSSTAPPWQAAFLTMQGLQLTMWQFLANTRCCTAHNYPAPIQEDTRCQCSLQPPALRTNLQQKRQRGTHST